jgi:hypothetical protein
MKYPFSQQEQHQHHNHHHNYRKFQFKVAPTMARPMQVPHGRRILGLNDPVVPRRSDKRPRTDDDEDDNDGDGGDVGFPLSASEYGDDAEDYYTEMPKRKRPKKQLPLDNPSSHNESAKGTS